MVIWITGLSGAGKTTIARKVTSDLRDRGTPVFYIDGDRFRAVMDDPCLGYDEPGRRRTAQRICRLAEWAEEQSMTVVVATISLFKEIHRWNREHFKEYLEIFVDVDQSHLTRRNPKKLYDKIESGEIKHVAGVDVKTDRPEAPHLTISNNQDFEDVEQFATQSSQKILQHLEV